MFLESTVQYYEIPNVAEAGTTTSDTDDPRTTAGRFPARASTPAMRTPTDSGGAPATMGSDSD